MSRRALLIGIDKYEKVFSLTGCVVDATRMTELLHRNEDGSRNFDCRLRLMKALVNRVGEGGALRGMAAVHIALSEDQKAVEFCNEALAIGRAINDKQGEANSLALLAHVRRRSGELIEARSLIEQAIGITESFRLKVASPELRASYLASARQLYDFYIGLLIQQHKMDSTAGHSSTALEASERARARSLLEVLTESRVDIRQGVDPTLLERKHTLQQLLNAKADRQMRLLSSKSTEEQVAVAQKEIDGLTTEYQQVEAQIRATSPKYAALTQPRPLSLKEIQQVLDPDTLLLEYFLGDDHSYLWAVSPDSITAYEMPRRAEIEDAARHYYDLITARNRYEKDETASERQARLTQAAGQYPQAAATLSQMLLGASATLLGKKRLVIVADGMLQYIPFAALPEPKTNSATNNPGPPLMVNHEIVILPSASALSVLRKKLIGRNAAAKMVAVLADPVFGNDDARVKGTVNEQQQSTKEARAGGVQSDSDFERSRRDVGASLPRLLFTRQEARVIMSFAPAAERKQALDFEANKATATGSEVRQYRIIHFATHGLLNSLHPELSGVVLSLVNEKGKPQDGFLRLHEIYNLKLPAELIVLSACQTELGKDIKGEGLVGLTQGFMYAGAARVIASLWKVDDEATAELMKRFYEGVLIRGKRPAAALREAQIKMWKHKNWQRPYFWAAFTVQGEWR